MENLYLVLYEIKTLYTICIRSRISIAGFSDEEAVFDMNDGP